MNTATRISWLVVVLLLGGLTAAPGTFQAAQNAPQDQAKTDRDPGKRLDEPPGRTFTETFDQDPVRGWQFPGPVRKQFIAENGGRFLRVSGAGAGFWARSGKTALQTADITFKFRYRYEQDKGIGEAVFRMSGTAADHRFNTLVLESNSIRLGRRSFTEAAGFQQDDIESADFELTPGTWHDVVITAAGSRIEVSIDGKTALTADDPEPLAAGLVGLGVIKDSGSVDYDDVELKVEGSADGTEVPEAARPKAGQAKDVPTGWQEVTSTAGQYRAYLPPGTLSEESRTRRSPAGVQTTYVSRVDLPEGKGAFIVTCIVRPQQMPAAMTNGYFDGMKAGLSAPEFGWGLSAESKITVEGYPGREWTLEKAGQLQRKVRAFVVENRVYLLDAGGPAGAFPDEDVRTFFEAFRLTAGGNGGHNGDGR